MRVLVLGVGDAFSARYYSSCFIVEAGGKRLLIDCPHPLRKVLADGSRSAGETLDVDDLDAVLLTHLHADHASGVEGLAYYSRFYLDRRMPLLAHSSVLDPLWPDNLYASMGCTDFNFDGEMTEHSLDDFVEPIRLVGNGWNRFGPFEIAMRRTIHPIPTWALKIRCDDRMLGYSADSAWDQGLVDWLEESDFVIHEANVGIHTPLEKLEGLPAELRARLGVIHYPDDLESSDTELHLLHEGEIIEVERAYRSQRRSA